VPADLASAITGKIAVPTIGIASGNDTDGQVMVLHDLLGTAPENRSYVNKIFHFYDDIVACAAVFNNTVKSVKINRTAVK